MISRLLLSFIILSGTCLAQENKTSINTKAVYTLEDDTNKVNKLLALCVSYYDINHDSSLSIANKALALAEKIQYKRGEVESLFRIGNDYFFLNHQDKAIYYFELTITKAELIKSRYWIARSYRQIASIYIAKGNHAEAVILNRKALNIHRSMSDSANVSQCFNRIGLFFMNRNIFDSSLIYIQKAIDINIQLDNNRALGRTYRNLANLYMAQGKLENAENYYKRAFFLQKEYAKKHEIIYTAYKYAQLLIKKKEYQEAIEHLNNGIKLSHNIQLLKNLPALYQELSLAKELSENYMGALEDYNTFITLNDSLQFKEEQLLLKIKKEELLLLESKKSIILLEQQKENQFINNENREKLTIILIIVLIVLALLIIKAIKKKDLIIEIANTDQILASKLITKNIRKEQFNAINEVTQNHEITKEQIAKELHDGLGGTLTAIKMNLMQLKKDSSITKIINDIGAIATTSRFISHELHPPLLNSQTFCIVIQDYLNHIFNNTDIELNTTILPRAEVNKLELNTQLTLYRIIQELCSNIKNHSKARKVNFQLLAHANDINLIIEDDGIGFRVSNTTLKTNKGLMLIKERLKIIDGEIEIDSQVNKGCTIYIFIPTAKQ